MLLVAIRYGQLLRRLVSHEWDEFVVLTDWASTTWLPELMDFRAADLTSRHFWEDKLPDDLEYNNPDGILGCQAARN